MKRHSICILIVILLSTSAAHSSAADRKIVDTLRIDTVPSWFPVGFSLLTHGQEQYVAYYNADHQMIVARRRLTDRTWQKAVLPSQVGWDSHNYITMAIDTAGDLHLAGNMHCVPLIYFRTQRAGDITSFARLPMTGEQEQRCTYPRFLKDARDRLLFMYRSGGSGNGRRFYNQYHAGTKTWSRFLDTPLFEGEGKRNAYPQGPTRGPDGAFHLVWVWRDTPDCATNHHLSHAQSRDLKHWTAADGRPLRLPLTLAQDTAWVDAVPAGGGIINGGHRLVFDTQDRPVIVYHKRDDQGHMQIYVARLRQKRWVATPVTRWEREVPFSGRGAMPFIGIRIGAVRRLDEGLWVIDYRHRDYGSGQLVLNEQTLLPEQRNVSFPRDYPASVMKPTIAFEAMRVKLAHDLGKAANTDRKYLLRWEALPAHHDKPRQPPLPPASTLELLVLE
jgi:hypothetical protein